MWSRWLRAFLCRIRICHFPDSFLITLYISTWSYYRRTPYLFFPCCHTISLGKIAHFFLINYFENIAKIFRVCFNAEYWSSIFLIQLHSIVDLKNFFICDNRNRKVGILYDKSCDRLLHLRLQRWCVMFTKIYNLKISQYYFHKQKLYSFKRTYSDSPLTLTG